MILSLRHIRRRIRSVENTKKMTHAMEMVAAAKLKKLRELLKQSDRYIGELRRILETLVQEKPLAHPLLEKRSDVKSTLVFLMASDTGLCGSYNTNILERANVYSLSTSSPLVRQKTDESVLWRMGEDKGGGYISPHPNLPPQRGEGIKQGRLHFVTIGRHGAAYLKRVKQFISKELNIPRPQEIDDTIRQAAQIATHEFTSGEADQVVFIYTKVESLGSLKPSVAQLFPIVSASTYDVISSPLVRQKTDESVLWRMGKDRSAGHNPPHPNLPPQRGEGISVEGNVVDYIIEPNLDQVLESMLPEFIEAEVGQFVKHSLVAEQASRMMAMRQATDNAEEMVDSLTLLRNKARQAAITKELLEVVSGSRALQMK